MLMSWALAYAPVVAVVAVVSDGMLDEGYAEPSDEDELRIIDCRTLRSANYTETQI